MLGRCTSWVERADSSWKRDPARVTLGSNFTQNPTRIEASQISSSSTSDHHKHVNAGSDFDDHFQRLSFGCPRESIIGIKHVYEFEMMRDELLRFHLMELDDLKQ